MLAQQTRSGHSVGSSRTRWRQSKIDQEEVDSSTAHPSKPISAGALQELAPLNPPAPFVGTSLRTDVHGISRRI